MTSQSSPVPDQDRLALRSDLAVFLVLLGGVAVLRLPTFFITQIGADESLYYLVAEQWRAGHLPYTTLWDNKPYGIYAIFALFQTLTGDRFWCIRLASTLFVAATAFFVFMIAQRFPGPPAARRGAALIGAGLYALCSLSNDGLEANTELFMTAFTSAAMLTALSARAAPERRFSHALGAGILFGLAFMTKYVALCEAFAAAFALLVVGRVKTLKETVSVCLGAVIGGSVPVLLSLGLYAASGEAGLWLQNSIIANLRRGSTSYQLGRLLIQRVAEWLPLWVGGVILLCRLPAGLPQARASEETRANFEVQLFLGIWLLCAILGICAAKGFYSHFFIEALPPLSLCGAWVILNVIRPMAPPRRALVGGGLIVLLILPLGGAAATYRLAASSILTLKGPKAGMHQDVGLQIARDLKAASPGRAPSLYSFDYPIILYALTGSPPPTRYVFPMFLTNCFFGFVAGVDAPAEEVRILRTSPEFIVRTVPPFTPLPPNEEAVYRELDHDLADRYIPYRAYDGAAAFRLRPEAPRVSPISVLKSACPVRTP